MAYGSSVITDDDLALEHALRGVEPFAALPAAAISAIKAACVRRDYEGGQPVYASGQYDGGEALLVIDGRLHLMMSEPVSGAMVVETLSRGEVFGLEAAIDGRMFAQFDHLTVCAEGAVSLVAIDAEQLRAIAAQRPSLTRSLLKYFAGRLVVARFDAARNSDHPEQRVYAALIDYAERDPRCGDWRISVMPKHRELAKQANAEEKAVAGAVAALIQDGIAHRDYPGLIIRDIDRLAALAG